MEVIFMAGKIIRLICIVLMSMWITGKLIVACPLLAIPMIGATVLFMINQIKEINDDKVASKKKKQTRKAVKKTTKK